MSVMEMMKCLPGTWGPLDVHAVLAVRVGLKVVFAPLLAAPVAWAAAWRFNT